MLSNSSHESRLTSHEIAISVRNLSKKYKLYDSPQHRLKEALNPFRKNYHREFWALKDVSFDVKKGETIGIIGQNGSGKSTLLQTICGILQPTKGSVLANGRISALLELGAGFNRAYTGRENIYMNGSVLGLARREIDKRLDDIISFADIGDFIDQPVKTYSSGMYMRLAFAVAINVDPDILVVDEALSVGDALFQHRCIAKIRSMIDSGVTLLFVSHSADVLRQLCKYGIWLEDGQLRLFDDAVSVSNAYQNEIFLAYNRTQVDQAAQKVNDASIGQNKGDIIGRATRDISNQKEFKIHHVFVRNSEGLIIDSLHQGEEFSIEIQLSVPFSVSDFSIGILIKDKFGLDLTGESIFNKFRKGLTAEANQTITAFFKSRVILRGGQSYSVALRLNLVSSWDRRDNILLYNDNTAAVFKVIADPESPMWFKFHQDFEVAVDVK